MYILGISCFYHDAAAALIKDGVLVAAAEEERFSRIKHDYGFPLHAIKFCLEYEGIKPEDLDYVVFYEKPFLKFERILLTVFSTFPKSINAFKESINVWLLQKIWIKSILMEKFNIHPSKIYFSEHHVSHAASTFYPSPFREASILSIDGVGEWTTTAIGIGKNNEVKILREQRFPHSLGLLYSAFTAFLGFEVNEGEYKVMGMAPYGEPRYVDKIYKIVKLFPDGSFWLDMDYFAYHYSTKKTFNQKFVSLFGEPRDPKERDQIDPYYADIAASIQCITEDILLNLTRYLHGISGMDNLCIAGGVGLNSTANGRILRETPFKNLFVQPSAGDGGGALGAALHFYHSCLGNERKFLMDHAYWGKKFENEEVKNFLDGNNIPYENLEDEKLLERVVEEIEKGRVIGWFQGRFEWGPRALGNRSIIADARNPQMKEIVNRKIKFREPFRPFAPSVLAEEAEKYFDVKNSVDVFPLRFMIMCVPVKDDKREIIPATTHVDGSARIQMVYKNCNMRYYKLIELFGEETGVPVILNTSFNLKGEPIVHSPKDALNTFIKSEMDSLVLSNFLIKKENLRRV